MVLFTIGYEGAELSSFLGTLHAAGVAHVLDVRELPNSRRRGFSKRALSEALASRDIDYTHCRALGTPRAIRHRFRETGDIDDFFSAYRQHMRSEHAAVEAVATSLADATALLCYERDPLVCHRSLLADELAQRCGCRVQHLSVSNAD